MRSGTVEERVALRTVSTPGSARDLLIIKGLVEAAGVEPASERDPPRASTCVARVECSRRRTRLRAEFPAASPLSLVSPQRAVGGNQPAFRRPIGLPPAGPAKGRHCLIKQRVRTGCCQLLFSSLIIEGDWTSACNPGFNTPVEPVSPPRRYHWHPTLSGSAHILVRVGPAGQAPAPGGPYGQARAGMGSPAELKPAGPAPQAPLDRTR